MQDHGDLRVDRAARIIACLAALALAVSLQAGAAQAGFNGSALSAAAADQATIVDQVRWVCVGNRCDWLPGHPGRPHAWAIWAAPRIIGCYYSKVRGTWVEVCP